MDAAVMKRTRGGFGLLEVVASMIILALMSTAIMYLQYGNRQAALRIQARNEATEIGQNVIDSLSALTLAQVQPISDREVLSNERNLATGGTMRKRYVVNVTVQAQTAGETVTIDGHTYGGTVETSKEILVDVMFLMGTTPHHINLSAVVK